MRRRLDATTTGWLLLAFSVVVWTISFQPWHLYMGDLIIYRTGSEAFLHGRDLYAVLGSRNHLHFTYPPIASVLMMPLAVLPLPLARIAISVVSAACLVFCIRVVLRRLGEESTSFSEPWLPISLGVAIWLEPIRATISFGQINLVLMALIVADLLVIRDPRRSGFLIGIAAAVKLTPLAFIPFLFATGRRRPAANAIVGFAGCALAGMVYPSASRTYWGQHLFLQAHRVGLVEDASNQSIRGVLARFLSTAQVPGWWVVVAVGAFAIGLAAAVRLYREGREVWSLVAMAITTLTVSPISWSHHWVWCAPMALACADLARRMSRTSYTVAAGLVVTPFVTAMIFWAPHVGDTELTDSPLQMVLSATYVLAGALLIATLLMSSRRLLEEPTAIHLDAGRGADLELQP